MKIEDIKIEDAADANYFIKKFFNNDYRKIKMTQLEQLVLTVYTMGKQNGVSTDGTPKAPVKEIPFKINDRVKVLDDVEIGHSKEFILANNVGTVTSVKEDTAYVLFEAGADGEMIDVSVSFDMLEKV